MYYTEHDIANLLIPRLLHKTISVVFLDFAGHCLRLPKKRAPENDADWCNRFVQNSHGEPIGDKNDSWAITAEAVMGCCNFN